MVDEVLKLSWSDVEEATDEIVKQVRDFPFKTVIAISRGGLVPGRIVAAKLGIDNLAVWDKHRGFIGELKEPALIVDDILDSGATIGLATRWFGPHFATLVSRGKYGMPGRVLERGDKRWVVFPWEGPADLVGVRQHE